MCILTSHSFRVTVYGNVSATAYGHLQYNDHPLPLQLNNDGYWRGSVTWNGVRHGCQAHILAWECLSNSPLFFDKFEGGILPAKHIENIIGEDGVIMSRIIPVPPGHIVNHVAGGLPGRRDFSFANLSCITYGHNARARVMQPTNTSGHRGVRLASDADKRKKTWQAFIWGGEKRKKITTYHFTEEDAIEWRAGMEIQESNEVDGVYETLEN